MVAGVGDAVGARASAASWSDPLVVARPRSAGRAGELELVEVNGPAAAWGLAAGPSAPVDALATVVLAFCMRVQAERGPWRVEDVLLPAGRGG